MATAKISYLGGLRTELTHVKSGSKIETDAPTDNEGKGELFSPTDLAASSLASCMITVMGIAANNHSINMGEVNADVTKVMASNPRRIEKIQIVLRFPDSKLTEKEKVILKRTALTCPVAKSLHPDIIQDVTFEFE